MPKRVSLDRKGSRKNPGRPSRPIKRKRPPNRWEIEGETASTSSLASKLKLSDYDDVKVNAAFGYRILNFVAVFSELSEYVKCKTCGGDVKFLESSIRGLGFKIVIKCNSCDDNTINSCPLTVNHAYEINRRFIFAMRVLGIGINGMKLFCGLMDLPKPVAQTVHDMIIGGIHCAAKAVCNLSLKKAGEEEKKLTAESKKLEDRTGLTVSGDGTWRKGSFSSLFGVATLIGCLTNKILDVITKSSNCEACENWETKADTEEYQEWFSTHECSANQEESSVKLEVDGIREMFNRSVELHDVKYVNYVGDGDSETFKQVVELTPHDVPIRGKECVEYLQKRMITRLRKLKKDTRGLDENGKLTAQLIDELMICYGLAIRNNCDSLEKLKKAVWATYFHKISTDQKPQHENCPSGNESWCTWQKAKAENKLNEYTHQPALHDDVKNAILPIYEELTSDDLLHRCLGGFTEIDNESLNSWIWEIAPRNGYSDDKITEIAAYIATCIFNDGHNSLLQMLQVLNIRIGPRAFNACNEEDASQIDTKEAGTSRIMQRFGAERAASFAEGLPYQISD